MTVLFVALLQIITPRFSTSGKIAIPPDSMMSAIVLANELRALPELPDAPPTTGVEAADELYQTSRSYPEMVAFFDRQFRGLNLVVRRATQTSTVWHFRRIDNKPAAVIVRNTLPTSFEIIEVVQRGAVGRERGGVEQHEPNQPEPR